MTTTPLHDKVTKIVSGIPGTTSSSDPNQAFPVREADRLPASLRLVAQLDG
jgi:hypothetical protein